MGLAATCYPASDRSRTGSARTARAPRRCARHHSGSRRGAVVRRHGVALYVGARYRIQRPRDCSGFKLERAVLVIALSWSDRTAPAPLTQRRAVSGSRAHQRRCRWRDALPARGFVWPFGQFDPGSKPARPASPGRAPRGAQPLDRGGMLASVRCTRSECASRRARLRS